MQNLGTRRGVMLFSSMIFIWGAFTYACSAEDENPASPRTRTDSGAGGDGSVDPTSTGDAALGAPICAKYGGYAKVQEIASGILERVSNDCRISVPVTRLTGQAQTHLQECFRIQLGGAFQCPGVSYVSNTTVDSNNQKCRDMTNAHRGLNFRNADFNAFRDDVVAELQARGLEPDDVKSIAAFIEGSRSSVVQTQNQPDKNTFCSCENGQYEGKPCVVDAGPTDAGNDALDAADADGG